MPALAGSELRSARGSVLIDRRDNYAYVAIRELALAEVTQCVKDPSHVHHKAVLGPHLALNRVEVRARRDQLHSTVDGGGPVSHSAAAVRRLHRDLRTVPEPFVLSRSGRGPETNTTYLERHDPGRREDCRADLSAPPR